MSYNILHKQISVFFLPLFIYLFRQKKKKKVYAHREALSEGMTLYQKLQATTLGSDKTK